MLDNSLIRFDADKGTFTLFTKNTAYQMAIGQNGDPLHRSPLP